MLLVQLDAAALSRSISKSLKADEKRHSRFIIAFLQQVAQK